MHVEKMATLINDAYWLFCTLLSFLRATAVREEGSENGMTLFHVGSFVQCVGTMDMCARVLYGVGAD